MADHEDYKDFIQKKLDKPMPWVGLYIAAASIACLLAMAADLVNGFRRKKLWFPCKYFSLDATSLTLLAVAMKLPTDINTNMLESDTDIFVKYISLCFLSTAVANFMPSLGSMTDKEVLANVVALGILVITVTINVFIQLFVLQFPLNSEGTMVLIVVPVSGMLLALVTLVSLAVTVPMMKRSLELKYQEKHKVALSEEGVLERGEGFRIDEQKGYMMKYLVMAETSSPQFVIARSVVCSSSAIMCLFVAVFLLTYVVIILDEGLDPGASSYGDVTVLILYIQSIGMGLGAFAPLLRWVVAVRFRRSTISWKKVRKGFRIEAYWTRILVEWRDSFTPLRIGENRCRKYLHDLKWFTLTFCIGLQLLIVLLSKLIVFLSILLVYPFFLCIIVINKFLRPKRHEDRDGDGNETNLILNRYVLVLDGEPELPMKVLKKIIGEADSIIKTGKRKQPKSLVNLLNKSVSFKGVLEFDQIQGTEPPNCWTLPIVTLTSIAIALPHTAKQERRQLLSSVSEGLSLVKIVEKTLMQDELVNIRKAADICWVRVVLYLKWQDIDLQRMSLNCKSSKEVLQGLSEKAQEIMEVYRKEEVDSVMENPHNWPANVLAASSMYRISQTIFSSYEDEQTDEGLQKRLYVMIADILAACLTNLARAITTMCHHNAIEKREKSARKAFFLLGKTEQVVQLLQQKEWPNLDHDKAACIDEWRALFKQTEGDTEV